MKKALFSLGFSVIFVSCTKPAIITFPIQEETKTIEFKIIPAADYTNPVYNGATAEVKLSVYKQFSNPYSIEIIWDTVISRQSLSDYMQLPNPYIITKKVEGVQPAMYKIGIGYSIGYISAPPLSAQSWSALGEIVPQGNQVTHRVQVNL